MKILEKIISIKNQYNNGYKYKKLNILGIKIKHKSGEQFFKEKRKIDKIRNNFTIDINKFSKKYKTNKIYPFLVNHISHIDEINEFLYSKLSYVDKKTFIEFLFKRYAQVEVIADNEKQKLDKIFKQIDKLLLARKNIYEPVEIESDIFNCGKKVIKFITGKENVEQIGEICACYNIVHSFILNEYFLDDFLPENGKVILDCGAAMGDTAIVFSKQYPDSKIYSFECIGKNIELLNKNLELNNISNVIPIKTFLASKTGKINIDSIEYDSISIDDYVKKNNINNIGLIKFDIEGAELEALNGGINTIKEHKPLLYIPIYHLETDIYEIPKFIYNLGLRTKFGLKWVEKRIWGVDCVLFCKFV